MKTYMNIRNLASNLKIQKVLMARLDFLGEFDWAVSFHLQFIFISKKNGVIEENAFLPYPTERHGIILLLRSQRL